MIDYHYHENLTTRRFFPHSVTQLATNDNQRRGITDIDVLIEAIQGQQRTIHELLDCIAAHHAVLKDHDARLQDLEDEDYYYGEEYE